MAQYPRHFFGADGARGTGTEWATTAQVVDIRAVELKAPNRGAAQVRAVVVQVAAVVTAEAVTAEAEGMGSVEAEDLVMAWVVAILGAATASARIAKRKTSAGLRFL